MLANPAGEYQRVKAAERRSQIGTGDRSERIRTYNFPQNRVTDHRIQMSWYNMDEIMEGGIKGMLEDVKLQMGKQKANANHEDAAD